MQVYLKSLITILQGVFLCGQNINSISARSFIVWAANPAFTQKQYECVQHAGKKQYRSCKLTR